MIWNSAAKSVTSDATGARVTNTTGEVLQCLWIWDSPAIADTIVTLHKSAPTRGMLPVENLPAAAYAGS
jgi:hypothetical protein